MGREISLADAAKCLRVFEDCTEAWFDPEAWQDRLTAGAVRLIGACSCVYLHSRLVGGRAVIQQRHIAGSTDRSIVDAFDRYMVAGGLQLLPELAIIVPIVLRQSELTYRQSSLLSRSEYYRSPFYQRFMRSERVEDQLSSVRVCPDGTVLGIALQRQTGDPAFTPRDEAVLQMLTVLVSERLGSRLATGTCRGDHPLSPRLRDVLAELLDGASEKQVADRLGISPATTHEYVTSLYRRFGVRSRGQLMAHCLNHHGLQATRRPTARVS